MTQTNPAPHHDPAERCSARWDATGAAWGSAPQASAWVALEQPGPWGADAFVDSRLPEGLGPQLLERAAAADAKPLLIRRVDDHAQDAAALRRVYLGGWADGRPWLLHGLLGDPAGLLDLPWDRLQDPDAVRAAAPWLEPCGRSVLLVCTNGKRDLCCSVRARPVATYAAGQRPGAVWECTHLGGHRYAPTALVLPGGAVWGRLDGPAAVAALDAADRGLLPEVPLDRHLRGLSRLTPAAQAADAAVRAHTGERRLVELTVTEAGDGAYRVGAPDGTTYDVQVTASVVDDLPVSCGAAPKPSTTYEARVAG